MAELIVRIALSHQGRLLLAQRADTGAWAFPGGHVEPGESLVQAAAREVQEELGISVQITGLVGIYSHPKWHPKGHHELLFAGIPGPEPIQCAPREVIQAAFFLPSDLPEPLYLWHRTLAQDAAAPPGPCVVRADLSPPPISPIQTRDQFEVALALSGMDRPAFYAHIAATVGHTSVLANELAVDG